MSNLSIHDRNLWLFDIFEGEPPWMSRNEALMSTIVVFYFDSSYMLHVGFIVELWGLIKLVFKYFGLEFLDLGSWFCKNGGHGLTENGTGFHSEFSKAARAGVWPLEQEFRTSSISASVHCCSSGGFAAQAGTYFSEKSESVLMHVLSIHITFWAFLSLN